MESLQLLIDMVKDLPDMAIYVLVLFFAYKVVFVGSIYGVIRLAINRLHSWLTTPKHELTVKEHRDTLNGLCIDEGVTEQLIVEFARVRKGSSYVHRSDVDRLKKAIDLMLEQEQRKAKI